MDWQTVKWLGFVAWTCYAISKRYGFRDTLLTLVLWVFLWGVAALVLLPSMTDGWAAIAAAGIIFVALLKWGR